MKLWWFRFLLVVTAPVVLLITAWDLFWDGFEAVTVEWREFHRQFAQLWREGK